MEHRVTDNLSRKSGARRWQPAALLVSFFVVMVAGFGVRLTADDSVAVGRNVRLHWQPRSLRSGLLEITSLAVEDIEIISPPSSEPRSLPQTLELPIGVSLHKLDIGALRVLHEKDGKPDFVATQFIASLFSDGSHHRVPDLRVRLDFGTLTASG